MYNKHRLFETKATTIPLSFIYIPNCLLNGSRQHCTLKSQCRVDLTVGSITAHCRCMNGMELAINWSWLPVSQTVHQPQV